MYIGETGRLVSTRVLEHMRHTKRHADEKWAVAEHSNTTGRLCSEAVTDIDKVVLEAVRGTIIVS